MADETTKALTKLRNDKQRHVDRLFAELDKLQEPLRDYARIDEKRAAMVAAIRAKKEEIRIATNELAEFSRTVAAIQGGTNHLPPIGPTDSGPLTTRAPRAPR